MKVGFEGWPLLAPNSPTPRPTKNKGSSRGALGRALDLEPTGLSFNIRDPGHDHGHSGP